MQFVERLRGLWVEAVVAPVIGRRLLWAAARASASAPQARNSGVISISVVICRAIKRRYQL